MTGMSDLLHSRSATTARILIGAAILVGLGACAGKSTRPETGACRACLEAMVPAAGFSDLGIAGAIPTDEQQFYTDMRGQLKTRLERSQRRKLNILVLSGGGLSGAYGAGMIHQWARAKGANPIDFVDVDLVTGISAGALQSVFVAAALGAEDEKRKSEALDDLFQSYVVEERDIFNKKRSAPVAMLFSNSLNDAEPLVANVRDRLQKWKAEIQKSAQRGIPTLIGTVQLEDGGFYVGRLDQLLAVDCMDQADCATTAIMASAAVPLGYPPRFIGGRMFVDGGVRHTSFMGRLARELILELAQEGTIDSVNLIVVRNGTMSANERSTCDTAPQTGDEKTDPDRCLTSDGSSAVKNGLLSIVERSIGDVMTNQIERDSLYRMAADLEEIRRRVETASNAAAPIGPAPEGFKTALWLSHMRNRDLEVRKCVKPSGVTFDRRFMECIRSFGVERAKARDLQIGDRQYAGAFLLIPDPWFQLDETVETENVATVDRNKFGK